MPKKSAQALSQLAALKRQAASLRRFCSRFPEAYEEHPWGESAFKVNKKVFTFLSIHKNVLHITTKLPDTGKTALSVPFAAPTGYGLGKNGWVTATFEVGDQIPLELIQEWIEESYRTIAPAKLSANLDGLPALTKKKAAADSRRKRK
jgi:predicted DNA-binding protein (MmcQ/YjbR family)